jgi:hypothetical protein
MSLFFGALALVWVLLVIWAKRVSDAEERAEYVAAWHARTKELKARGKCLHCRGDGEAEFLVTCPACRGSGYDPTKIRSEVKRLADAMEYQWEEAARRGARVCRQGDE